MASKHTTSDAIVASRYSKLTFQEWFSLTSACLLVGGLVLSFCCTLTKYFDAGSGELRIDYSLFGIIFYSKYDRPIFRLELDRLAVTPLPTRWEVMGAKQLWEHAFPTSRTGATSAFLNDVAFGIRLFGVDDNSARDALIVALRLVHNRETMTEEVGRVDLTSNHMLIQDFNGVVIWQWPPEPN